MAQICDSDSNSHNDASHSRQLLKRPVSKMFETHEGNLARKPITDSTFHKLVKDVCAGRAIDPCYGEIGD